MNLIYISTSLYIQIFKPPPDFNRQTLFLHDRKLHSTFYHGLTNYCVFSNVADETKTLHFNAEIVGFNVQGKTTNLDPPVEIEYGLYDVS